jgi:hypothetical protein
MPPDCSHSFDCQNTRTHTCRTPLCTVYSPRGGKRVRPHGNPLPCQGSAGRPWGSKPPPSKKLRPPPSEGTDTPSKTRLWKYTEHATQANTPKHTHDGCRRVTPHKAAASCRNHTQQLHLLNSAINVSAAAAAPTPTARQSHSNAPAPEPRNGSPQLQHTAGTLAGTHAGCSC